MRTVGADHVIDYAREDFTRNGRTYDLVLDLAAYRSAFAYARSSSPGGRYFCVGGSVATLLRILLIGPALGRSASKKIRVLAVRLGVEHLGPMVELCQTGKAGTPRQGHHHLVIHYGLPGDRGGAVAGQSLSGHHVRRRGILGAPKAVDQEEPRCRTVRTASLR